MTKKEKQVIARLKNTYCTLKLSKIHGIGVFAIRDIPKNINPFFGERKENWCKIDTKNFKNFDKEVLKMIDDFFAAREDGTMYIPEFGLNSMNISNRLNHSKKPNLKIKNEGNEFVTIRKIKKGEELVVDYGTFDYKYL